MEIDFEHSLRVTLKPCKILSMGTFFTPDVRMLLKREWIKAICWKSVFMEGPALLRRPYISIFIKLCHSTFIYFILPLPPYLHRLSRWRRPGASEGADRSSVLVTPPYDPQHVRAKERVFLRSQFYGQHRLTWLSACVSESYKYKWMTIGSQTARKQQKNRMPHQYLIFRRNIKLIGFNFVILNQIQTITRILVRLTNLIYYSSIFFFFYFAVNFF